MDQSLRIIVCNVCTAVAVTVVVAACTVQERPKPNPNDPYLDAPLHMSTNMSVVFYDSTTTRAELTAGTAYVYENRSETLLGQSMKVVFIDKNSGKQAAVLTADSAVIDDRTRNMTAIGNVVVVSDSNRTTLKCPRLVWNHATEKITTDDEVKIITPSEVIDGKGLVSDQYLTSYRIFHVTGIHQP